MFEREIKFIYDFNLNKVNRLGPYFTFEQLSASEVHPAILHYISAEIDYLIFEDRQKLLKNSIFDYSGEKISYHFSLITDEVKKSKRISLEYISKLILHASSFTINYLVRPKWALRKFVYDEGDHKTTTEIKQILNYIYYYHFLKKIIFSYINTKKILSMNSAEFGELLDKVDNLGVETNLQNILSNSLKAMAEFFNIGEIQKNKIPLAAVEMFLEEKRLTNYLKKIQTAFGEDKNLKLSIADYQKVFDSVLLEKSETLFDDTIVETEEIKEPIAPVAEEVIEEKIEQTAEVEIQEEKIREEKETQEEIPFKPTKLRIRIDKENEIEPVAEDEITADAEEERETLAEEKEEYFGLENVLNEFANGTKEEEVTFNEEEVIPDEETMTENEEEVIEEKNILEKETDAEEIAEENGVEEDEIIIGGMNQMKKREEENLDTEKTKKNENVKKNKLDSIMKVDDEPENVIGEDNAVVKSEEFGAVPEELLKMGLAEILEHKDMTKIIEAIFDYDIEEFANTIDEISNCGDLEDADIILNQTLKNHNVNRNSKEAETFRAIISEYFNRR
ncbi:MAG: hypothetical protein HYS25_09690 [Ignavibacteriales bacterium]|nr:hypothetical protein [Ignavibacteriales bacterium]